MHGRIPAASLLLLGLVACRPTTDGRDTTEHTQHAATGGRIVAVVNGHSISVQDVQEAARARRLSAHDALRELEAEQLLLGEAAKRGYGNDDETRRTIARASVQTLLERDIESGSSTTEARVEQLRALLTKLERRDPPVRNEAAIERAMAAPAEEQ